MSEAVVFADIVELTINHLRLVEPELLVGTDYQKPTTAPVVTINRTGGVRSSRVSDQAYLSVDVWAPDTFDGLSQAHDTAQLVRARIAAMAGTSVNSVAIYRVGELAGPARFPSPDHESDRWTFAPTISYRGQPI